MQRGIPRVFFQHICRKVSPSTLTGDLSARLSCTPLFLKMAANHPLLQGPLSGCQSHCSCSQSRCSWGLCILRPSRLVAIGDASETADEPWLVLSFLGSQSCPGSRTIGVYTYPPVDISKRQYFVLLSKVYLRSKAICLDECMHTNELLCSRLVMGCSGCAKFIRGSRLLFSGMRTYRVRAEPFGTTAQRRSTRPLKGVCPRRLGSERGRCPHAWCNR